MSWRACVWVAAVVALLVVAIFAFVALTPLAAGRADADRVLRDDRTLAALVDARVAVGEFERWIEPVIFQRSATVDNATDGATLFNAMQERVDKAQKALEAEGFTEPADELRTAWSAFDKSVRSLDDLVQAAGSESSTTILDGQRTGFAAFWQSISEVTTQVESTRDHHAREVADGLDGGYDVVIVTCALAALAIIVIAAAGGQRARRRQRVEESGGRLADYEAALQDGLEMSKTEADVYAVSRLALQESVPRLGVQMLIADSSRAHFSEMLHNDAAGIGEADGGCGVVSPVDCPSAARGHTLVFPDSRAINACPHLRHRPTGDCSAVCVPVNIAGTTVGVTHAWGAVGTPPERSEVSFLEVTSRRASERLAMLRAFAKSETQARNDPLTGMWNRRSLENQVHDLQREGVPFAVAYGDLDHFKQLNDTHGHGTGDQALRLFSRVLRDSIRPHDMAARYGGEEFIVVLPNTDTVTASAVLERIRERLALALASGRVPAFTVSFGLASSLDGDTFDDVVALADEALLAAKTAGRNRVVVAHEITGDAQHEVAIITDSEPVSRA